MILICECAEQCNSRFKGECGHSKHHEQFDGCDMECELQGCSEGFRCIEFIEDADADEEL